MNAIEEYKIKKKEDKIYEHLAKSPLIFPLVLTWDLYRQSVNPAIQDFLKLKKNVDYKHYPWESKIYEKKKELFGDAE